MVWVGGGYSPPTAFLFLSAILVGGVGRFPTTLIAPELEGKLVLGSLWGDLGLWAVWIVLGFWYAVSPYPISPPPH